MSWTDVPPGTDKVINVWSWLYQFYLACDERWSWVTGSNSGPQSHFTQGGGQHQCYTWQSAQIAAIDVPPLTPGQWVLTLTVVNAGGGAEPFSCPAGTLAAGPYAIRGEPGYAHYPSSYGLIIDHADPKRVVRASILDNGVPTLDKVTISVPPPFHSANMDPANLIGLTVYAAALPAPDHPWWSERIMQWSNDSPISAGTAISSGSNSIEDLSQTWTINALAGKHLWINGYRYVVASNTAHTITVTCAGALTLSGDYVLLENSAYWEPGRISYCWKWSGSPTMGALAHVPEDPAHPGQCELLNYLNVKWLKFTDSYGLNWYEYMQVNDREVWHDLDAWEGPNKCETPYLLRTLRGLQVWLETIGCYSFCSDIDYPGYGQIPNYNRATFGAECLNTGVSPPPECETYWVAYMGNEPATDTVPSTKGICYGVEEVHIGDVEHPPTRTTGAPPQTPPVTTLIPCDRIRSWSFDRYLPAEFLHFYDRTAFVPDIVEVVTDNGIGGNLQTFTIYGNLPQGYAGLTGDGVTTAYIYTAPTSEHPGRWITRPQSDHLKYTDDIGACGDSALAMDAFVEGMYARYVGDNFNGADIRKPNGAWLTKDDVLVPFYDQYFEGQDANNTPNSLRGNVVSSTLFSLTADADWWRGDMQRIESGTATGGSTTSLNDSTKATTVTVAGATTPALWNPATGRWVGFTVEIQMPGILRDGSAHWAGGAWVGLTLHVNGADYPITGNTENTISFAGGVVPSGIYSVKNLDPIPATVASGSCDADFYSEKRLISGFSGTTISWDDALPAPAAGMKYRIREPQGQLNRLAGRTLVLGMARLAILGNDDHTIFFATQAAAPTGSFTVEEAVPGTVYQRSGGTWVLPAEAGGSLDQAKKLPPTVLHRYGWVRKGDYLTSALFGQIKTAIQTLKCINNATIGWTNKGETNAIGNGGGKPYGSPDAASAITDSIAWSFSPADNLYYYVRPWKMDNTPPGLRFVFDVTYYTYPIPENQYRSNIQIESHSAHPKVVDIPNKTASYVVSVYSMAQKITRNVHHSPGDHDVWEFDTDGAPFLLNQLAKVDTISGLGAGITGARLGSSAIPNVPSDYYVTTRTGDPPTDELLWGLNQYGYVVGASYGVAKYMGVWS